MGYKTESTEGVLYPPFMASCVIFHIEIHGLEF